MTWKLQAISAELAGQEISIDRDMLVGRHQAADIVLQSSEISRKHAAFLRVEDALWLQDLASSNGTFVNDTRISEQVLLKDGDIVQFASLKFSVLAPAVTLALDPALEQSVEQAVQDISPAKQMNEQGMPSLKERDASVQLSRDGMPTNVGVPKPAPIPEGVDLTAATPEPKPVPVEQPESHVEAAQEQQKNTTVGLMTVIAIIIIAVLAFVMFK
ncbi:FHA domain-containing protein [Acinetobacter sp. B51(2017)]|uniref:FHA domain-containing protein n=1 Tax=Acinetobacter sp. B51(2017) TaxID=2060938 RepID=UPI000F0841D8|nr:FHA domain-containing protein [Acinetobacter sp. B51(2017)]